MVIGAENELRAVHFDGKLRVIATLGIKRAATFGRPTAIEQACRTWSP